ncbi:MAG: serine/threonine-protein kinase [Polyangiales bacterium]
MSDIFDANHVDTGHRVAIKVLPKDKLHHSEYLARMARERALLELAAGTGSVELRDSGFCTTYGPFLVMEYLIGRPLDGLLVSNGRMSVEDALPIFIEVSDTLARLHELRIVHRDIKPANVFITAPSDGNARAVLLDFGVSARRDLPWEPTDDAGADLFSEPVDRLTTRGEILGTIEYMSPEQLMALHEEIGYESDIFSLGVLMFELLSGELPYGVDWPQRLHNLHHTAVPRSVSKIVEGVPSDLAQLISRMIANRRVDRPASMRDVHEELKRVAMDLPLETRAPLLEGLSGVRSAHDRRHNRAVYATPVRIIASGRVFDGRSEDVSEGGMLLIARQRLAAGERMTVRFALPLDGEVAQVEALVCWCREGRGRVAMGITWVDPSESFSLALRSYVDWMLDPDRSVSSVTLLDAEGAPR